MHKKKLSFSHSKKKKKTLSAEDGKKNSFTLPLPWQHNQSSHTKFLLPFFFLPIKFSLSFLYCSLSSFFFFFFLLSEIIIVHFFFYNNQSLLFFLFFFLLFIFSSCACVCVCACVHYLRFSGLFPVFSFFFLFAFRWLFFSVFLFL